MGFDVVQRWQLLFLRLNEIEARAGDPERIAMARFLLGRISPVIPERLILRPGDGLSVEVGPTCTGCARNVLSTQLLSACTACLRAVHYECWRRCGGCPTPACVEERANLPLRQLRTG